jgi:hypothetical protein
VYEDATGTQESVKQAAEYIRTTLPSLTVSPPEVIDGESIISFSA